MSKLPDFVKERINQIIRRTGKDAVEIRRDYDDIFNEDFIQLDEQFRTDEDRHRYCIMILWVRWVSRPIARKSPMVNI